jgi:hypothetical protein
MEEAATAIVKEELLNRTLEHAISTSIFLNREERRQLEMH